MWSTQDETILPGIALVIRVHKLLESGIVRQACDVIAITSHSYMTYHSVYDCYVLQIKLHHT